MNFNEEDEWLAQLTRVTGQERFRPYLESIGQTLSSLVSNWKSKKIKIVTIGGTNGKGETAMSLEYYCQQHGLKAALWTSPHILSVTERMKYDGQLISWKELQTLSEKHWNLTNDLSFYEFLFALFCFWVNSKSVDVVILEVGLGGRYDAVNIFDADLSALTSIDLDHQEFLGDTKEKILGEKYPISRSGKALYTTISDPNLRALLQSWATRDHVQWSDLFELDWVNAEQCYSQRNRLLAATLFMRLTTEDELDFKQILRLSQLELSLKARFELMTEGNNQFIFIGAHNVEGIREMIHTFRQKGDSFNQVWLSFSKRSKEDLLSCFKLMTQSHSFYEKLNLCTFNHQKACAKSDLDILAKENNGSKAVQIFDEDGWKRNLFASEGRFLVTGSYYFISAVQRFLLSRSHHS